MPAVDMALAFGGVVQFAANGDLVMVQDTPTDAAATQQRITFAILTNPRLRDAAGNVISTPGDVFHPDYGGGLPALVGENYTEATINGIVSRVQTALAADPYVATSPAPTVTVTRSAANTIIVNVVAYAKTGQPITLPPFDLSTLTAG